jgi:hypothetical protein
VRQALILILTFGAVSFAIASAGEDVNGWQEAKWGMTPDQVQRVLTSPTSVADLTKVCRGPCNEGTALELEDYQLNGQHFTVRFWFGKPDERLQAVSMYGKNLDKENGKEVFTQMRGFFEKIYGAHESIVLKQGDFVLSWTLQSTKISLYSNTADHLTVLYEQRMGKQNSGS